MHRVRYSRAIPPGTVRHKKMDFIFFGFTIGFLIGCALGVMAGSSIERRAERKLRDFKQSRGF
jgi:putative Ca2+/H+ antiporter (TMEM165/GDT1 family)